ncbi:Formyltetrahydrofolate deformylase [Desulfovibrionales bacterium]
MVFCHDCEYLSEKNNLHIDNSFKIAMSDTLIELPDNIARLLISCPDRPGIVAAVTTFLANHGANITGLDQYTSNPTGGTFFMRLEFQTSDLHITGPAIKQNFQTAIADPYQMCWRISYATKLKRITLLVSSQGHCLFELLWRWSRDELPCQITQVLSNHPIHRELVERFGVPYHYLPITTETHKEVEHRIMELVGEADLVVLARYMRILSPAFVQTFQDRVINIHHSFLPAFVGADPYRQAFERGVKIIGATAHYVTKNLDSGPIIEQDVVHISHRHTLADLKALGRDLERQVLARAVKMHLEDRIIRYGNKTVVLR